MITFVKGVKSLRLKMKNLNGVRKTNIKIVHAGRLRLKLYSLGKLFPNKNSLISKYCSLFFYKDNVRGSRLWTYTRDDLARAVKAVLGGERLAHAAAEFNIPSSTLWDKVKAARCGVTRNKFSRKINKSVKSRTKSNYTLEDLDNAVDAVLQGGQLTQIARNYNIPTVTLFDNVKRNRLLNQSRNSI